MSETGCGGYPKHAFEELRGESGAVLRRCVACGHLDNFFKQAEPKFLLIPMLLWCPCCHIRHVDKGEFVTKRHHTHACQHCGMTWRPAIEDTVGVQFLPGFKDERMLPIRVPSPEEIEEGVLK